MTQRKEKELTIYENEKTVKLVLKDGFSKKASVLKEIRDTLQEGREKEVSIFLEPQKNDAHNAMSNIRQQIIGLRVPCASITSRSRKLFKQKYAQGKHETQAVTYKLSSENGVCSIKFGSFKHPIEGYDETAKEIACILATDTPQSVKVTFVPGYKESQAELKNRINNFASFLRQRVVEIPQIQEISFLKEENSESSVVSSIKRNEKGQISNVQAVKVRPVHKVHEKPVPNLTIVSKYRLRQQRNANEHQNGD